ncbi:hypothetical protein DPMN_142976 [Dreissena polymorpha]|uniref:Uncharacterized protein n=1 Tax=Dreissena polymorpha TaxID=45954 RepID=A0A9D4JJN1_DREPO|nr:hypothetical protein DPMN_142976 [Dreissena polymorpha]
MPEEPHLSGMVSTNQTRVLLGIGNEHRSPKHASLIPPSKQKSSCMNCQGQSTVSTAEEHLNLEECTWTQSTRPIFKDFSYMNILEWTKSSGKGSKLGVEKPIQRGYVFFHDGNM